MQLIHCMAVWTKHAQCQPPVDLMNVYNYLFLLQDVYYDTVTIIKLFDSEAVVWTDLQTQYPRLETVAIILLTLRVSSFD